ncbi:hypothetical protein [Salmonirosea aquatica]|uniref:Uncharacterized protein n=1 Tax=Salmonirosea aquatica TaxID=2654236 RepID=A0A7C9FSH9_9BACT|nr:hypothetical protein [Cytophagaceae bacterium SJW1-29]
MTVVKILSYLCLLAVVLAPILFYADTLTESQMKTTLLVATVVWFATAATWINKEEPETEPELEAKSPI